MLNNFCLKLSQNKNILMEESGNIVKSPMVGTFYMKPSPTSNPYVEIGSEPRYSEPTDFFASISMSGGESVSVEFGVDIGNYDAVIVTELNEFPLSETSYVWVSSEPQHSPQGLVDVTTADFRVTAVKPSLNQTKYLLMAITK